MRQILKIMAKRVIGIGETVLDILFKNDQPQKAVPGGSTFNSIVSLGRAGVPCVMVTEVGDDHIGTPWEPYVINLQQREGIDNPSTNDQRQALSRVYKIIENGHVFIIRNGERYSVTGTKLTK